MIINQVKRNNSGSKIFHKGVPGTTTEACPGRPGTTTEADQGRPGTTPEADQGILGKMGTIEDRISNWTNLEIKKMVLD